jgi:hypothetical protein
VDPLTVSAIEIRCYSRGEDLRKFPIGPSTRFVDEVNRRL